LQQLNVKNECINLKKEQIMKTTAIFFVAAIMLAVVSVTSVKAQSDTSKSSYSFTTGADVYSNYIWRGSKFGTGPAFQPTVKFTTGGLTIGVWGSFDAAGYTEADPYISYTLPFGLTVGATDYYYPGLGGALDADSSHAVEANVAYTYGAISVSANYIFNKASVPASAGKDKYFEVDYAFSQATVFVGAGDGWHTSDGDFNVCNVGVKTVKNISLTDKFSIPATGAIIINPEKKFWTLVVGLSF
jgi:hypothetical protein